MFLKRSRNEGKEDLSINVTQTKSFQSLGPLTPGTLDPSFSTKLEKNPFLFHGDLPDLKQITVAAKNLSDAVLFKGRHAVFYGLIPKNFHG
jgi:hypothetical protein